MSNHGLSIGECIYVFLFCYRRGSKRLDSTVHSRVVTLLIVTAVHMGDSGDELKTLVHWECYTYSALVFRVSLAGSYGTMSGGGV